MMNDSKTLYLLHEIFFYIKLNKITSFELFIYNIEMNFIEEKFNDYFDFFQS